MKKTSPLLLATLIGAALQMPSQAAGYQTPSYSTIVSLAEDPGQFNSTLRNTNVQTFDNLVGINKNVVWEGVGTFDQLNVLRADQYGGAPSATSPNGTAYAVEGLGAVKTTTLSLNQASSYFGMYWSAGDSLNDLKFYNGNELVANFTTANLMNLLPKDYFGNPIESGPNAGANSAEPYAFINFFGDKDTAWDKIVFGNNGGSGFEADNYTTRVDGWNPQEDGTISGKPVINIQSNGSSQTVSKVTKTTTNPDGTLALDLVNTVTGAKSVSKFAPAAPAAPAPPLPLIAAFASVIALKGFRRKKVAA